MRSKMSAFPESRSRLGLTIIEIIASLFILALAAVACVMLVGGRDSSIADRASALEDAPLALDMLHHGLQEEGLEALRTELEAGSVRRLVYMTLSDGAPAWWYGRADSAADLPSGLAKLYVATLSAPQLRKDAIAMEFDVSLGWLGIPVEDDSGREFGETLGSAHEIARYRELVLREGLLE